MADGINVEITGDRRALLRFENFPNELYDALRAEIESLTNELFGRVLAAVPHDSGKLASEIHKKVHADPERISGQVFVSTRISADEARKAAALEYGSRRKKISVKAHSREVHTVHGRALAAPLEALIKAYDRTPNIMQRAFERGTLDEMRPQIIQRLQSVVSTSVADANGD